MANTNTYGIVDLPKINGADIVNFKYRAGALENGQLVKLAGLISGDNDLYSAVLAGDTSAQVYMNASVELMYSASGDTGDFRLATSGTGRGIGFVVGNEFTVTVDVVTGTAIAVGYWVTQSSASSGYLECRDTYASAILYSFVAEIIEDTDIYEGNTAQDAIRCRVVRNQSIDD